MAAGYLVAAVPQVYLNVRRYGRFSTLVNTGGLMTRQLLMGLQFQRYDTYVGTQLDAPWMTYVDESGVKLLKMAGGSPNFSKISYIKLCLKYPFEMAGIFFRHMTNVLTPFWNNVYVKDLQQSHVLVCMVSFTLFFMFAYICFNSAIKDKGKLIAYVPVLMTAVFITPGAVEARFYIPVYILAIGVCLFNSDWGKIAAVARKNKLKTAILYFFTFGLVIAIWTSTLASYQQNYVLLIE